MIDWSDIFYRQKLHEQMTVRALAEHLKVHRRSVQRALARRGLEATGKPRPCSEIDWRRVLVVDKMQEDMSTAALAETLGVSQNTVQAQVWRYRRKGLLPPKPPKPPVVPRWMRGLEGEDPSEDE